MKRNIQALTALLLLPVFLMSGGCSVSRFRQPEKEKEETVKAVMDALAVKGIYISDIEARMRIARQMKENGEKTGTAAEKEEKKDGEEREDSLWYF